MPKEKNDQPDVRGLEEWIEYYTDENGCLPVVQDGKITLQMVEDLLDRRVPYEPVVIRVEEGTFGYKGITLGYVVDDIYNEPITYEIPEGFWDE